MTEVKALAFWVLEIWHPDKMNFAPGLRRRKLRLFYKAKGIVLHDRFLNEEWSRCE